MRKFIIFSLSTSLLLTSTLVHAGSLASFAEAIASGDTAQIRAMLAPRVEYERLGLVGHSKMSKQSVNTSKAIPFLHAFDGVEVEGDILRVITSDDFIEEWEWYVAMSGGRVTRLVEIAIEGSYPGSPDGCPDTSLRRQQVASVYGQLGQRHGVHVRVFRTPRNTDAWSSTKNVRCRPTPGISFEDVEVVAQEKDGTLIAYEHVGRFDQAVGEGMKLYGRLDGGAMTSGGVRLYTVGGEGFLFLSRVWYRATLHATQADYRVTQFALNGTALKQAWSFDFGRQRGSERLLWAIDAPGGSGYTNAHVAQGTPQCPAGQTMQLMPSGTRFKIVKSGVPGACFAAKWPGGEGGILARGNANLEGNAKKAMAERAKHEKDAPHLISSFEDDDDDADADDDDAEEAPPPTEYDLVH